MTFYYRGILEGKLKVLLQLGKSGFADSPWEALPSLRSRWELGRGVGREQKGGKMKCD